MLCIGYATVSFAAPSHGVKYTPHNLSTTRKMDAATHKTGSARWDAAVTFKSSDETEICVFCHTPHNAAQGKTFLWNRSNQITTFNMYTGSPTLNFTTKPAAPSEVSKMCMTCHDGVTALNAMANPRPVTMEGGADQIGDIHYGEELGGLGWRANIGEGDVDPGNDTPYPGYTNYQSGTGGVLLNDHPISFVYSQSLSDPTIKTPDAGPGGSSIGGLPFWWSDNGTAGYKVECVTCHDPHINYNPNYGGNEAYLPFLRKSNASSSLCFTCHDK